ncbi:GDSL-type esterase/lipase family protein [Fictibacillus iocasae]|uniref:GDSL-type esterase/lipase family protein n=1 Tax=Fictibacillus iocasae TaxID=2715437 RepID=A0ABW2NNG2_9BACL
MKKTALLITASAILLIGGITLLTVKGNLPAVLLSYITFGQSELKDQDETELTAIGDSLAFGVGDEEGAGYIGDVKFRYEKATGRTLELKDFGVPGDTSSDMLKRLNRGDFLDEVKESDILLVNIGTNDLLKATDDLQNLDERKIEKAKMQFVRNMIAAFKKVENNQRNVPIYIIGLYNPVKENEKQEKVEKVIQEWNNETKKAAVAYPAVTFIATDDLFRGKQKEVYFSDQLHPNKKGYALIGERVFIMLSKK